LILGSSLDTKPKLFPYLIVWLPNLIFQSLGLYMLRRANRGI
jgi:lipopolysaccharide export LptBFGC system permease protein LptF